MSNLLHYQNTSQVDLSYQNSAQKSSSRRYSVPKPEELPKSNAKDLIIVLIQVFMAEAPRGIILPTLSPYIQSTGINNPDLILGLAVSAFSIGRLISAYPFGYLADNTGSSRFAFQIATVIVIIANTIFAFAGSLDSRFAPWAIIVSRFFVGFGSGTLGVSRAFMAKISSASERTQYITWNTLAQYSGFSLTPVLAEGISRFIPHANSQIKYGLIPGLTISGLSVLMFLLLCTMRPIDVEDAVYDKLEERNEAKEKDIEKQSVAQHETQKLFYGFILYLILNFSLRGVLGVAETYGGTEFQSYFPSDPNRVDRSSEFFFYLGLGGIFIYFVIPKLAKLLSDFYTLVFGILSLAIGSFLLLPYFSGKNFYVFVNAMVLIWSMGSPITQTLTISTYSQMMGCKPQGAAMGWLTTAGSLGRILFPIVCGVNLAAGAIVNVTTCALSLVLVIIFRLVYLN
ncbi:hypothetical protein HDV06_005048 [Boothiomyces sp. JEL0866]|nr:hypothetical protein HDV06_005048 [Boothiomyces sp. JEL0866]